MASIFGMTDPPSDIDYSIVDGRVRSFCLRGVDLYDEQTGLDTPGWKDELVNLVKECGLDDRSPHGYRAFIYWMAEQGLLSIPPDSASAAHDPNSPIST